jgi:hypothetical protein
MSKTGKPKHLLHTMILLVVAGLILAPPMAAQTENTEQPEQKIPAQDENASGSTEVEFNEDNYRRHMELRDTREQRTVFPETEYQTQTGRQKIADLPEESQKHLRDELREVILSSDRWQPGNELLDFPYHPSVAAKTNQPLQEQESQAWDELVESYHQREADIFQNAARARGAESAETANGEGIASDTESGRGEEQDSDRNGSAAGGNQPGQETLEGSYSPESADAQAVSTLGVSQNAMEYLLGSGQQPGQSGSSNNNSNNNNSNSNNSNSSDSGNSGNSSDPTRQQEQSDGSNNASEHAMAKDGGPTTSANPTVTESNSQAVDPPQQSSEQSATEEQQANQENTTEPSSSTDSSQLLILSEDTLSVKDLVNAKGVRDANQPVAIQLDDDAEDNGKLPESEEDG